MGLSAWNAYRARQAAQQKALEQSKFLDDVVVEPTSPVVDGGVGTLPAEKKEEEIEVKPKRKRK